MKLMKFGGETRDDGWWWLDDSWDGECDDDERVGKGWWNEDGWTKSMNWMMALPQSPVHGHYHHHCVDRCWQIFTMNHPFWISTVGKSAVIQHGCLMLPSYQPLSTATNRSSIKRYDSLPLLVCAVGVPWAGYPTMTQYQPISSIIGPYEPQLHLNQPLSTIINQYQPLQSGTPKRYKLVSPFDCRYIFHLPGRHLSAGTTLAK